MFKNDCFFKDTIALQQIGLKIKIDNFELKKFAYHWQYIFFML